MEFLAWPAVVLILGVIALIFFKKELSRFLDRAERISVKGIEAGQPAKQLSESLQTSGAAALLTLFDNALLLNKEALIDKNLREEKIEPAERERVLLRFLAAAAIRLEFEETYRIIFGSQLGVLELLNTLVGGLKVEQLRANYEKAKEDYPDVYEDFSFDSWLSFLTTKSLISLNKEGVASITVEGKEFLKYLIQMGYSLFKRY